MKLSKNFDLNEFVKSDTAKALKIINSPNIEQIVNIVRLCDNCMQKIRDYYKRPVVITSGYRCAQLNSVLGSKPTSQHSKGEACDFHVDGCYLFDVFLWCKNNLIYDQLILENVQNKGSWIHISYNHYNNRHQALKYDGKKYIVV